jgi:hypothetical protein
MSKKHQIFISSTYDDLKEEREQVIKAVLEMGHIPVGMEMFSAADEEQWKIIARQIDDIDYYAVICAHRYGSVTDEGISYTEKEYDYASERGVPILGFVIDDSAPWPANRRDVEVDKQNQLVRFKSKIKSKLVNLWSSKDDLHGRFSISLMKAITANPRVGWVRADESAGPGVMKELSRLSSENAALRGELDAWRRKDSSKKDDKYKEIIRILDGNASTLYVWYEAAEKWAEPESTTLLRIFEAIAPGLQVENVIENVASDIALALAKPGYRRNWPVPNNHVKQWMSDFVSLNLIEPSSKKHSVSDTHEYWSLSRFGRDVFSSLRKLELWAGIPKEEVAPENE